MGKKRTSEATVPELEACDVCNMYFPASLHEQHQVACAELTQLQERDDLEELSAKGLFRIRCHFCVDEYTHFNSSVNFIEHLKNSHQVCSTHVQIKPNRKSCGHQSRTKQKKDFTCDKCSLRFTQDTPETIWKLHQITCSIWKYMLNSTTASDLQPYCVFCLESSDHDYPTFSDSKELEQHLLKVHRVGMRKTLDRSSKLPQKPKKRKRPAPVTDSPYSSFMLDSFQRKLDFPYKTPCLYHQCNFTHSIQPHLNFEHYRDVHNKTFSCRHYCPVDQCGCSYSRKNVLAAHLRKAHEIEEDDIPRYTGCNDDIEQHLDCLICGTDLTHLTAEQRNQHFENLHGEFLAANLLTQNSEKSFTSELLGDTEETSSPTRLRLNSIGSKSDGEQQQPLRLSNYHPLSGAVKRYRAQVGTDYENVTGYPYMYFH